MAPVTALGIDVSDTAAAYGFRELETTLPVLADAPAATCRPRAVPGADAGTPR